jgi:hypothetical protein
MTFENLIQEYYSEEDERAKLRLKEAVLFEGMPKKHRISYCKERGFLQTEDVNELLAWLKDSDYDENRYKISAMVDYKGQDIVDMFEEIADDHRDDINKFLDIDEEYKISITIEKML